MCICKQVFFFPVPSVFKHVLSIFLHPLALWGYKAIFCQSTTLCQILVSIFFFPLLYNFFSRVYAYMCCLSGKTAIRQKFNCQTSEFVLGAKHSIRLQTNGGDADIHPLLDSFLPPSSNISWHLIEKERSNKQL